MSPESAAQQLLVELGIDDPGAIDLDAVAWLRGAEVHYAPMQAWEARIVGDDRKAIITVNSTAHPQRQRFSVAHEIGHWELHRGHKFLCRPGEAAFGANDNDRYEREADQFAAELVMPAFLVRPMLARPCLDFETVAGVGDAFNASFQAAARRATQLSGRPAMLLSYDATGQRRWFQKSAYAPPTWVPLKQHPYAGERFDALLAAPPEDVPVDPLPWLHRSSLKDCRMTSVARRYGRELLMLIALESDGRA